MPETHSKVKEKISFGHSFFSCLRTFVLDKDSQLSKEHKHPRRANGSREVPRSWLEVEDLKGHVCKPFVGQDIVLLRVAKVHCNSMPGLLHTERRLVVKSPVALEWPPRFVCSCPYSSCDLKGPPVLFAHAHIQAVTAHSRSMRCTSLQLTPSDAHIASKELYVVRGLRPIQGCDVEHHGYQCNDSLEPGEATGKQIRRNSLNHWAKSKPTDR